MDLLSRSQRMTNAKLNGASAWVPRWRTAREGLRAAVRALSEFGALREPETAGFYVGFVAGVLGANPKEAERLVGKMLPLPPADQWLVVRAIAYSGLPAWKSLLARTATKVPARRGMGRLNMGRRQQSSEKRDP